jgi:hypothetical protein
MFIVRGPAPCFRPVHGRIVVVLEHQVEKRARLKNAPINQRNQTIKGFQGVIQSAGPESNSQFLVVATTYIFARGAATIREGFCSQSFV